MSTNRKKTGFTIVELLVVIVVIAILASITYFVIQSWRRDSADMQVKNELLHAAAALKQYRNFNSDYPGSGAFTPIYEVGDDVTLNYTRRANGTYCLNGSSHTHTSVRWNIDSNIKTEPRSGACTP